MQITKIEQQVKNNDRVSVYVDEKFSFGISKRAIVSLGIKVGQEITNDELISLKQQAEESKLADRAIVWALRRNHSEREIRDYLKQRADSQEQIEDVFNVLVKLNFVDDQRFAETWYESRRRKGYSTFQIRGELFKKGVDASIINSLINQEDELTALKHLVEKKSRLNSYKDKTKLKAYLLRKGYRYSDVENVLNEI